jgi:2-methylaconitate cis-trans-isomerase PrpF
VFPVAGANRVNFINSAGSKTGRLLPTGNVVDVMELDNAKSVRCSLVDAAAPQCIVQAKDIGLTGTELPSDTPSNPRILGLMEEIRAKAAVMMKLAPNRYEVSPAIQRLRSLRRQWTTPQVRKSHHRRECDLVARTKALAVMHKAYAITEAFA